MRSFLFVIIEMLMGYSLFSNNVIHVDTSRWATSAIRLNTNAAESHPMLSADGQTMYFVRNHHVLNIGEEDKADIWVAYRDSSGVWSKSVNIGAPLNNANDNQVVGISLNNETLYLTGDANNQIFFSKNKNRTWSIPRALTIPNVVNDSPTLNCNVSIDEKYILFAMSNEFSLGKRDVFVSIKNDLGEWSSPKSLGNIINTAGDEANVFLAADNHTLYFCTDSRDGLGGLDWYMSRRLDDTWQNWTLPLNLGNAVNTDKDDLFFCINTELGECYGTHHTVDGDADIARYIIQEETLLPLKTTLVYGRINTQKGEPIQTIIQLQRLDADASENSLFSKADGSFLSLLVEKDKIGFYANDKNAFSSIAYLNLNEKPLKVLDNDGSQLVVGKDSSHLYNSEQLQIKISRINQKLTLLEKEKPTHTTLDVEDFVNTMKPESSFEEIQNLEKIRFAYQQKYKINNDLADAAPNDLPKSYDQSANITPSANEIDAEKVSSSERAELMKKGFEAQKKKKEQTPISTTTTESKASHSEEDDRRAIEDISQLHRLDEQYIPAFDVVVNTVKRKIATSEYINVKSLLQKELIEDWNNWKALGYDAEDEKKVRNKIDDLKRQTRELFADKNALEASKISPSNFNDDEKNVMKPIKNYVLTSFHLYLKDKVRAEVDYEIVTALHNELRNQLYKGLEKEKKALKHPTTTQISPNEIAYIENERKSNIEIVVYPLKNGVTIPLKGIFFAPNSADLLPESMAELERIKKVFEEDQFRIIELNTHTHGYCSDDFANQITTQRANNLKKALVKLGVSEMNIVLRPMGKNAPLTTNNTPEGRLKNQRVEMKLISR